MCLNVRLPTGGGLCRRAEGVRLNPDPGPADGPCGELRWPASCWSRHRSVRCFSGDHHAAGAPPSMPAARHRSWWDAARWTRRPSRRQILNVCFVYAGLDVSAITKLVVEAVREQDDTDFTHHSQTLETGTTKVQNQGVQTFWHQDWNHLDLKKNRTLARTIPTC